jgi:Tol biopolymer transport system component/DNA-binding winged helix-turn-helix (wHTH) protein
VAFDRFDMDLRSGELHKDGRRIRLQAQPFQLLALLIENAGEVVTREEICRELWPSNTFVDFEHSLAAAVNKIRDALGDSADDPKYIETLPKRGYRFTGNIKPEAPVVMPAPAIKQTAELSSDLPKISSPIVTRWRLLALFALALLAVAIIALWWVPRKPPVSELMTAVPFTSYPGQETNPAISPDGSRIAFGWDNGATNNSGAPAYDLYVKANGSETVLRLTNHPSEWVSPAWSPDGTQIAFHRIAGADTGIYMVPALGGPERKLIATHTPYDIAALLSWSPDGKWIAYSDNENGRPGNTNFLLNLETLQTHELPHDPACIHEGDPTFSHSGQQLALVCVHSTANFEYFVADTEGKSRRSLATQHEFPTSIAWGADDKYLIVSRYAEGPELDKVWVGDGRVEKIPISAEGIWPSITPDGKKLAFSSGASHTNIWRRDLLHPEAPPEQMYKSTLQQDEAQYSPDGRHVAFDSTRSGVWSVWMANIDGSNLVQISNGAISGYPRWSPDSQKICFEMKDPDGSISIYVADIADRVPRRLSIRFHRATSPSWSRDGKWIYFRTFEGIGQQIYRSPAAGGAATLIAESDTINMPVEAPDGKTLYFMPLYGGAPVMMLSLDHLGANPRPVPEMAKLFSELQWIVVPDGIYFTPQDNPRAICFYEFATRRTREVFRTNKDLGYGMSVSPDGHYMLYSQLDENNSNIMLVNNFR